MTAIQHTNQFNTRSLLDQWTEIAAGLKSKSVKIFSDEFSYGDLVFADRNRSNYDYWSLALAFSAKVLANPGEVLAEQAVLLKEEEAKVEEARAISMAELATMYGEVTMQQASALWDEAMRRLQEKIYAVAAARLTLSEENIIRAICALRKIGHTTNNINFSIAGRPGSGWLIIHESIPSTAEAKAEHFVEGFNRASKLSKSRAHRGKLDLTDAVIKKSLSDPLFEEARQKGLERCELLENDTADPCLDIRVIASLVNLAKAYAGAYTGTVDAAFGKLNSEMPLTRLLAARHIAKALGFTDVEHLTESAVQDYLATVHDDTMEASQRGWVAPEGVQVDHVVEVLRKRIIEA